MMIDPYPEASIYSQHPSGLGKDELTWEAPVSSRPATQGTSASRAPQTARVPVDVQAQGKLEALESAGRGVTRVTPSAEVPAAIERLAAKMA